MDEWMLHELSELVWMSKVSSDFLLQLFRCQTIQLHFCLIPFLNVPFVSITALIVFTRSAHEIKSEYFTSKVSNSTLLACVSQCPFVLIAALIVFTPKGHEISRHFPVILV